MLPRRRSTLLLVASLLSTGCGYVGDPLPPLANIPGPVTGLAAVERGNRLVVQFQLPTKTTENVEIRAPLEVELRAAAEPVVPFDIDRWAAIAKPFTSGTVTDGSARYEIPVAPFAGRTVTVSARVTGAWGKSSDWATPISFPVVAPPPTPTGIRPEAAPGGVHLSWQGPAGTFRVLRRAPGETAFTLAARVDSSDWTDLRAETGKTYAYLVQRVVDLGGGREAESELPAEVTITPRDTFAPDPPSGLRAAGAPNSIELSWDRNPAPDLAGYRVYRAAPGADFERVAEIRDTPAYSDRTAESSIAYRYAVTAFDQSGNESARSAVVQAQRP